MKRTSTKETICLMCGQEGFGIEEVYYLAKALLCRYAEGRKVARKERRSLTLEMIRAEKQYIRRKYLEIMKYPCSEEKKKEFIWAVVRASWFQEKAHMILDEFKTVIDEKDAGILKTIIYEAYIRDDNTCKSEREIQRMIGFSRSSFYEKKKEGITLFGILMWMYAKRRELEDIEKGVVSALDENVI